MTMVFIYLDTNVIRYFGKAFHFTEVDSRIRSHIILSPLSVVELLAQLGGGASDAKESFDAIQSMWNWLDRSNARILDWPRTFIKEHVFGIPIPDGEPLPLVTRALNWCHQGGPDIPNLRRTGAEIANSWKAVERKSAEARRSNVLLLRHRKIKASRELLLDLSVQVLRREVGVTETKTDHDEILGKLKCLSRVADQDLLYRTSGPQLQFSERKTNERPVRRGAASLLG